MTKQKRKQKAAPDLNTYRLNRLKLAMDFAITGLKWSILFTMFVIGSFFMLSSEFATFKIWLILITLAGITIVMFLALLIFTTIIWFIENAVQLFEQPTATKQKRRATSAATRRLLDDQTETQAEVSAKPQYPPHQTTE